MREVTQDDGTLRRRLRIELKSRLLRQEWRYDGLLFGMQSTEGELPGSPASGGGGGDAGAAIEIRVVGKASRWDVSDASAPVPLGEGSSFSMIKKEVDKRTLYPTIKPFSAPVDPEAQRLEDKWSKLKEESAWIR